MASMSERSALLEGRTQGAAGDERKVDADGVLMPDMACTTPLRVIGVQKETPVCWSADGSLLAFVFGNKALAVHRAIADGPHAGEYEVFALLEGHEDVIKAISFHPKNNNMMVSGGYEGIFVWDIASKSIARRINADTRRDAHSSDVLCFEWAFDGTSLLSGSKDSDVKVWDTTNDFKLLETIVGHKASVLSITFSPVSKMIATAGRDSTIKVWDGTSLVVDMRAKRADDSGIKCALLNNLDGHRGDVVTLTWDASGYVLFSGARDNSIKVWDGRSGVEIRELEHRANYMGKHRGDVRKMVCIPHSPFMITCSLDSTMKVWKVAPTEAVATLELTEAKRDEAEAKLLSSILGDQDAVEEAKAVGISDELITTVELFTDEGVHDMALNPAMPVLATSSSTNAIKLWRVDNFAAPTVLQEFRGHVETVNECCLLDDLRLVTVSNDYFVHMYNIDSSERPRHTSFESSVLCAALRPGDNEDVMGYVFAGGADYSIKAYRLDTVDEQAVRPPGRPTRPEPHEYVAARFEGHSGRVQTMAIRDDGKLMASGGFDYCIMLWKLENAYPLCSPERPQHAIPVIRPHSRIDAHKGHIMCLRFKPTTDGRQFLASCSNDHSVKVWKVTSGMMRGTRLSLHWTAEEAHESCVSAVEWGKGEGSNTLFSSSWDRSVCMFDVNARVEGGEAQPMGPKLIGHAARVTDMDVSEDGRFLVTVSVDVTAVVWDIHAGCKPIAKYTMSETNGFPSSLSAGRNMFVTASGFGQIMVWPLPVPQYLDKFTQYHVEEEVTLAAVVNSTGNKAQVVSIGLAPGAGGVGAPAGAKGLVMDKGAGVGAPAGVGAGAGAGAGATVGALVGAAGGPQVVGAPPPPLAGAVVPSTVQSP